MKKLIISTLVSAALVSLSACGTNAPGTSTTGTTFRSDTSPQSTLAFPDSPGASVQHNTIPNAAGSGAVPETQPH